MASQTTFTLAGDPAAARAIVDGVARERGYALTETPNGAVKLTRGSLKKTLLIGALAGKDFHLQYLVAYAVDAEGRLVVTLWRELGGSAVKGGALGASRAADEYQALVDAVGAAASGAGVYVGHESR